jgi:hypothetical protein
MSTPEPPHKAKWTKGGPSPNPGGKKRVAAQPAQPEAAQPESNGRNKDGTFAKGSTPNPAGRPKGSFNKSTLAALAIMEADAEKISKKAVELALAGDGVALRLVMERLVSPVRESFPNWQRFDPDDLSAAWAAHGITFARKRNKLGFSGVKLKLREAGNADA